MRCYICFATRHLQSAVWVCKKKGVQPNSFFVYVIGRMTTSSGSRS